MPDDWEYTNVTPRGGDRLAKVVLRETMWEERLGGTSKCGVSWKVF
jgi:hypothetical protein